MSEELRPCPFCKSNNTTLDYYEISGPQELGTIVVCNDCGASAKSIVDWNTRPIEDALNARIAELEEENDRLQAAWFVEETICPDGSLKPKASALLSRIAELEAENETIISDYEERMDNLVNIGNETGRLLQAEIGYLNAQLGIKNLTTETLQLRIAELEAAQRWHVVKECNDVATPIDVALRKRIAELEGRIDQLTAHSDIERQDDKCSGHGDISNFPPVMGSGDGLGW